MSWYTTTDPDVDSDRVYRARLRMWVSVLVLAMRDYTNLHIRGYLKNGKLTKKCQRLGRLPKDNDHTSAERSFGITSIREVADLVDFINGDGMRSVMAVCELQPGTEAAVKRGLRDIRNGVYRALPSPDRIIRLTLAR